MGLVDETPQQHTLRGRLTRPKKGRERNREPTGLGIRVLVTTLKI